MQQVQIWDLGEVSFVSIGSFLVTGCRISTRLEEPTGQGWTKFGWASCCYEPLLNEQGVAQVGTGYWVQLSWGGGPSGPTGSSPGGETATSANPTPASASQLQLIFFCKQKLWLNLILFFVGTRVYRALRVVWPQKTSGSTRYADSQGHSDRHLIKTSVTELTLVHTDMFPRTAF